ncbi:hypothetical protein JAAARDRAFT_35662 [Jaapia argillacea MUCL 33604]|uniref:ABC transporter domain-containing protein n=1 Tax=Jaapia argillacea MUCL 33604 TaxID=933084 RepID=A0A067Q388_9AGAM|nr:hypothetical protein JAAARDRAFT_35662 [Jaapia argillacea MUCL 33604]
MLSSTDDHLVVTEEKFAEEKVQSVHPIHEQDNLLGLLPKPVPYSIRVHSLSIEAPPPGVPLPLPVPIHISPRLAAKLLGSKYASPAHQQTLLLSDAALECYPGEVLAIIGSSGSGKTTLLNAIGHRNGRLKVLGGGVEMRPYLGNRSGDQELHQIDKVLPRGSTGIIGFVRQDDFLYPYLTVRETLRFSAYLRLPSSISAEAREAIVERTISELGLRDAANTIVGDATRKGISGGERRRLSIGCVLVTLPSVLLLDEPTTGLDATAAFHLLSLLSSLARRGRTVILSIHQPRSDAYTLFDRICLLARGSVVYSGRRSEALPWFAQLGFEAPLRTNPLDFLVDISAVDTRDEESEVRTSQTVENLTRRWRERSSSTLPQNQLQHDTSGAEEQDLDTREASKRPGMFAQTVVLTRRALLNVYRDRGQLVGFLLQVVLIGVMAGLTFYRPPETPAGIQSLKTLYFQGMIAFFYLTIILFIFINSKHLVVFDREREDHLYSVIPFVFSHFVSFLPINIVVPGLYAIILYFMCNFRPDHLGRNLFIWIGNCILQQLSSFAYALFATSVSRGFAEASLMANGISIMFILSAGYLIVNLPAYIGWTRWMSPYFYGFRWVAITQFQGREFECPGISGAARNQCLGDNVLRGLQFNMNTPVWVYPVGLVGFLVVVLSLSTCLLHFYHPGGVRHAAKHIGKQTGLTKRSEKVTVMNSPPERAPVHVDLRDVTLTVTKSRWWWSKPVRKEILSAINLSFAPGRVSVILGPSGAGKSSLLEIISGQLAPGLGTRFEVSGHVLFNDSPASDAARGQVAFVQQSDNYLLPALTIRETLHYAAELQLRGLTKKEKIQRAEEVLRLMGLRPVADNIVGGETVKGISGGEKRRLSLAVQLVSDPSVLICDEPTSGLDAFTALSIMDTLQAIAASGRTVIATVHQPRSEIWATSFDDVVLLSGGKTVYTGPKDMLLPNLEAAGEIAPLHYNPTDFALDLISIDRRDEVVRKQTTDRLRKLVSFWESDNGLKKLEEDHEAEVAEGQGIGMDEIKGRTIVSALPIVLGRSWKNLRRQQDIFIARLANPPFLVLLFWLFFLRLSKGPSGAQDRVGLLMENSAIPFVGMLASIAIFPSERDAFYREYKNPASRYSAATFVVSYSIQEIPMQLMAAMLYSIVMVGGMGLQLNARIYFEFVIGIFGLLNFGESVGIIFSSWVINGGLSVSLVSSALTILAQICGIISVTIPKWLRIIAWGSALTYQSRVAFINEFSGLKFTCTDTQIASGECLAVTGDQMIETFGFKDTNTAKFTGLLLVLITVYRLLAYFAVRGRVALL